MHACDGVIKSFKSVRDNADEKAEFDMVMYRIQLGLAGDKLGFVDVF
jgi:hypothetical protein